MLVIFETCNCFLLACSAHCTQHGCNTTGAFKCDKCDLGYGLNSAGACDGIYFIINIFCLLVKFSQSVECIIVSLVLFPWVCFVLFDFSLQFGLKPTLCSLYTFRILLVYSSRESYLLGKLISVYSNGICHFILACAANCTTYGCNAAKAFKCDQCDAGFGLTLNATCSRMHAYKCFMMVIASLIICYDFLYLVATQTNIIRPI